MSERPSWYCCEACSAPHTAERPLVPAHVTGAPIVNFRIHRDCVPALREKLRPGTPLTVDGEHFGT